MLVERGYRRENAVLYARRWALSRNPVFTDYTGRGGNCTNFVSQCLYAGSCVMNFTPVFGWYYITENRRTASWTGVTFLYDFLTENRGEGPFGREVAEENVLPGDVIQLGRDRNGYYHSLLAVGRNDSGELLVAAQSDDALDRPLSTYTNDFERFVHIDGVRLEMPEAGDCFDALYGGRELLLFGGGRESAPELPETETETEEEPA